MTKPPADLVPVEPAGIVLRSEADTRESARRYSAARLSANTMRAYRGDWRVYERWCSARSIDPVPFDAERIVLYLTDLADGTVQAGRRHQWGRPRTAGTVSRHLAAIGTVTRLTGNDDGACRNDDVLGFMAGVRRAKGTRAHPKRAAVLDIVRAMVTAIGSETTRDVRDRAMILLGFWTACRRSEIAALTRACLRIEDSAVFAFIAKSKTDQIGAGRWVAAPAAGDPVLCPVVAMQSWFATLNRIAPPSPETPAFLSLAPGAAVSPITGEIVGSAVKRAVQAADFDPDEFAGHSLRSGFVTTAGLKGVPLAKIAQKTGHRRLDTLRAYLQDLEGIENDAGFGLA